MAKSVKQKDTPEMKSTVKDVVKKVTKSVGEQAGESIDKISQKAEILAHENLDAVADKIGKTTAKATSSFVEGVEKYNILTRLAKILGRATNKFINILFAGCVAKIIIIMSILVVFFLLGTFLFKLIF